PVFQGAIASSSLVASLRAADHSEERRRSPSFLSPQLLSIPQPLALGYGMGRQQAVERSAAFFVRVNGRAGFFETKRR
ncbi:MAG TPA: hypothetical protein IAA32_09085, partial [Candidatus Butyricicoccus stercorigallinarum]|nr:hypothetical protein [Candidatus Butyricicoccus stercorigallinarum]